MTIKSEEVNQMLNDLLFRKDQLTEWETKFFDSLCILPNSIKGNLSIKQQIILEKIWERVTEKGIKLPKTIGEIKI